MKTETIHAVNTIGAVGAAAGAAAGTWAWLTSNGTLGLLGLLVAVLGTLVTTYYKRKADRRAAAADARIAREMERREDERRLRMELMRTAGRPIFHRDTEPGELVDMRSDD